MTARVPSTAVLAAVLLSGCRNGGPPAALPAGEAKQEEVAQPAVADEPADAEVPAPPRDLWFSDGPGREAILARERRDYATAAAELDALLADGDLAKDDRGAAEWLRGLEDLRAGQHAVAADRFAAAAKVPALQPVQARLAALEAQARLDAGDPDAALAVVRAVPDRLRKTSSQAPDFVIIEADALARSKDAEGAAKRYRAYLRAHAGTRRALEAKTKLARLLARSEKVEEMAEAIALYEALLLAAPISDYGKEAAKALPGLSKASGKGRSGKALREFHRDVDLAVVEANLGRKRYKTTIAAADKLLRGGKAEGAAKCRALFAKASAIFKQRKRAAARPVFDRTTAACKGAKALRTYEVKARYQGARGLYAEGKYTKAAGAFESLAKEHADHSYADDAWVLAGESWAEAGSEGKAAKAYEAGLAVGGDMANEARRRLLLQAFAGKNYAAALALCDAALKTKIADPAAKAKLHYFRGRALQRLGKADDAVAAWQAAVDADPMGYPALQALSRLRDVGTDALEPAVKRLGGKRAVESTPLVLGENATAAVLLARLGLGEEAREELAHADIKGWNAVDVLNEAGLYSAAQRMIANLGRSWRVRPPTVAHRREWELAHPLAFADLIAGYEKDHGTPHLLTFAVMKTESRYDPGATSWAGARGLIQLMPGTAASVAKKAGVKLAEGALHDPATNLDLGMRYLAGLVARYGGDDPAVALAIPSYNAGAGAVDRWLGQRGSWDLDLFIEAIPYDETRHYTQSVLGRWWAYRWLYELTPQSDRIPYLPLQTPTKP